MPSIAEYRLSPRPDFELDGRSDLNPSARALRRPLADAKNLVLFLLLILDCRYGRVRLAFRHVTCHHRLGTSGLQTGGSVSDIFVRGYYTPFLDFPAYMYMNGFSLRSLFWIPTGPFRTLSDALSANPQADIEHERNADTPTTLLFAQDNLPQQDAKMRADVLGTMLRDAPTKNTILSEALNRMADADVKWEIRIIDDFTSDQKATLRSLGKDPSQQRGLTEIPGNTFESGEVVKTYIKDRYADSKLEFGKILSHELAHVYRDPQGNYLEDSQIIPMENTFYQNVFSGGRTKSPDGASVSSSATIGTTGNDLIHLTAGNSVADAGWGNNTIISYSGNDIMLASTGSDYFSIEGAGSKAIRDKGGRDTVYLPWLHSHDDFEFALDGTTLYISVLGADAYNSEDRLAIFDWGQGYGAGAIETLRYTDNLGSTVSLNLTNTARLWLGLSSQRSAADVSENAFIGARADATPHSVIGDPLEGFGNHVPLDRLASGATGAPLQIDYFTAG